MAKHELLLESLLPRGPTILLPTDIGDIDIHNYARLERLVYWPRGAAELRWVDEEPDLGRLGWSAIRSVTVHIQPITKIALTPPDMDVPRSEDPLLDYLLAERGVDGSIEITFVFIGGVTITLACNRTTADAFIDFV